MGATLCFCNIIAIIAINIIAIIAINRIAIIAINRIATIAINIIAIIAINIIDIITIIIIAIIAIETVTLRRTLAPIPWVASDVVYLYVYNIMCTLHDTQYIHNII